MDLTRITSRFNFYQQVRSLLRKLRDGNTTAAQILDNKLHFVSTLSLDAPDGQITSIEQEIPEGPLNITVWNNGLTGAMGALPTVYGEWLIERHYRYGDRSAKAFLDIFGHRLYCLYAHAESESEPPLKQATLAFAGLLISSSVFNEENYAHLFSSPVRSLVNLEVWLSHYYGTSVHIEPFTGRWKTVDETEHCQLGKQEQPLGIAPMIGRVRWEVQSHFDVTLGPIEQDKSQHFLPQGKFYQEVWARIREYVGPGLDFKVYLSITSENSSPSPLGEGQLGQHISIGRRASSRILQVYIPQNMT
jgi:type VI secretion system protein ImpH